jgi:Flp pilus assembly pilin Flp
MISRFAWDEDGAVTVEWVVMAAGGVGLSLAVTSVVSDGLESASGNVARTLTEFEIPTDFAGFQRLGRPSGPGSMSAEEALAYTPYDQAAYDDFLARLRNLTDAELAVVDSGVTQGAQLAIAAVEGAGGTVPPGEQGGVDDREAALALVASERGLTRDTSRVFTEAENNAANIAMGWGPLETGETFDGGTG